MTVTSTPGESWDDDRLAAAFAARAQAHATPADLTARTLDAVRADRRGPSLGWRPSVAAAATVAVVVCVVAAVVAINTSLPVRTPATNPGASMLSPTPAPTDDGPKVFGLPVMTVAGAIAVRDRGVDDREIAVRGWYPPNYPLRACGVFTPEHPESPLQVACPDRFRWLMQDPEAVVSVTSLGIGWRGPIGPAISPDFDDVDVSWAAPFDDPARLVDMVVIGHFDDSGAERCPPPEQQACRDRIVVDRVERVDGSSEPLSVLDRVDGPEQSTSDDIRAAVEAGAPGRPILSILVLDAASEGFAGGTSATIWVARVLDEGVVERHLVFDGTKEFIAVIGSRPPTTTVLGLPVISVPELIARRAAGPRPSPEELAVRGWMIRSNAVSDCATDPDPHPLTPWCQAPAFLMDRPETLRGLTTDGPSVVPVLGPDANIEVGILSQQPVEVIALGHLGDHRWQTCRVTAQETCRGQFVVDRIVSADALVEDIPEPWRMPSGASPQRDPELVRGTLQGAVGDVDIISIGVIAGDRLADIEPIVRGEPADGSGVWVVRALVRNGPDPTVARTFLLPDTRRLANVEGTVSEVTATGVVPPTPPLPSTAPWPPDGATVVELKSQVGVGRSPVRVAVVDRSGLLTSVREVRSSDPPFDGVTDSGRVFLASGDGTRLRLVWIGSVCDGDLTVTIEAGVEAINVDGGTRPACDAMGVGRELVLTFGRVIDPASVHATYVEHVIFD